MIDIQKLLHYYIPIRHYMDPFIQKAKAISDPTRVRMLKLLEPGELCVCEIMEVLGIKQPTASKHLNILKFAGIVKSRKQGTWSYYRLSEKALEDPQGFFGFVRGHLNDDPLVRNDRKRLQRRTGSCK